MNRNLFRIAVLLAFLGLLLLNGRASAHDAPYQERRGETVSLRVISPDEIVYGYRPMTVTAEVKNLTNDMVYTTGLFSYGGPGWGQRNHPFDLSPGLRITEGPRCISSVDEQLYCSIAFAGWLNPKQIGTIALPMFTGKEIGHHEDFLYVQTSMPEELWIERSITLTKGEGDPFVRFHLVPNRDMQPDDVWQRGQEREYRLFMTAPWMIEFEIDQLESTCGVKGLGLPRHRSLATYSAPGGPLVLPKDAPSGQCTIKGRVIPHLYWPIEFTYTFEVR